jgi:heterodisulfide reductase subunit C
MTAPSAALAKTVAVEAGTNANTCYQCKRCTAGCPVAEYADLHPAQIMRAVQLGDLQTIVGAKFIWLCTGCQTCTTRCPQGIDVAGVIDELRMISRREGLVPKDAPFADILRLNCDSISRWGRLYEIELIARYKMTKPATAMDDVLLGAKMFLKGKLSLTPTLGDRAQIKRMRREAERIEAEHRTSARIKAGE